MKKSPFRIINGILEEYLGRGDDVTIPQGVKIIGRCAFWGKKIVSVDIPDGVVEIDDAAFKNCKNTSFMIY